jgi:hypothetical protein
MEIESTTHLSMLIQSLQLLAAGYEQQVNALPAFVHILYSFSISKQTPNLFWLQYVPGQQKSKNE